MTNFAQCFRNAHQRVQNYLDTTDLYELHSALTELDAAEEWLGSDQEVVALKHYRKFISKLLANTERQDMTRHDRVAWAHGRAAAMKVVL
jgi:hypothetical protein